MSEASESKKNKIGILLLKDNFLVDKLSPKVRRINIDFGENIELYSGTSFKANPSFVNNFLLQNSIPDLYSATARAILVVKNVLGRDMVVTFGNARSLLGDLNIERDFGIKTAMNAIDPNNIKNISKVTLDSNPANSQLQRSITTNESEFNIDSDYDLAKKISGKVKARYNDLLGVTVEGSDSLILRTNHDVRNVRQLLERVLEIYGQNEYKNIFPWFENARIIKDKGLRTSLDADMVKILKNSNTGIDKVWASAPEYLDLETIDGYVVGGLRDKVPNLNFTTKDILGELPENFTIEDLKKKRIYAISSETRAKIKNWPAYKCLYAEINKDEQIYILVEGEWYVLRKDFVSEINKRYSEIRLYKVDFPAFDPDYHTSEGSYNEALADELQGKCLDVKNIYYGGSYNKIEICDVLTDDALIHCKIYGRSSVLTYLFQQGLNSGTLLKSDKNFIKEAKEQLSKKYGQEVDDLKRDTIVYCIISKKVENFEIPFFSKISICHAKRNLEALGYKVFLKIVEQL